MAHHIRICGKGCLSKGTVALKTKTQEVGFMSESPDLEPAKFRENPTAIAAYLTKRSIKTTWVPSCLPSI